VLTLSLLVRNPIRQESLGQKKFTMTRTLARSMSISEPFLGNRLNGPSTIASLPRLKVTLMRGLPPPFRLRIWATSSVRRGVGLFPPFPTNRLLLEYFGTTYKILQTRAYYQDIAWKNPTAPLFAVYLLTSISSSVGQTT